jgi:hypothetical protein
MRLKCICVAITILLLACTGLSQERFDEERENEKAAVQFLLDNKANSTAADPHSVDAAFAALSFATGYRKKNYIKFLVGMLDFERWTPNYSEASERQYPAMSELMALQGLGKNVVPYLINGIKNSDSEVLRTNAAETLLRMNHCLGLTMLKKEADKEEIPFDQKERLETAVKYIVDNSSRMKPCEAR